MDRLPVQLASLIVVIACAYFLLWKYSIESKEKRMWNVVLFFAVLHQILFYTVVVIVEIYGIQTMGLLTFWSSVRSLHLLLSLTTYFGFKALSLRYRT